MTTTRKTRLDNNQRWISGIRPVAILALAACHAPTTARAVQPETAAGPVTVLHVLTDAEGIAVRGAPVEMDGRLYVLAGERGPNGAPQCSSSALWQMPEHTQHCPGSLFSIRLDGSDPRVGHAFTALEGLGRNADGYHPYGTLAVSPDHRLIGVAQAGGNPPDPAIAGFGVLFAYDPEGDVFEVLHTFFSEARAFDGEYPMGIVAIDEHGNVFGTAKGGGAAETGTVWEWSPGGSFRFAPLPAGAGETYGGPTLAGGLLHGTTLGPGLAAGSYFVVDPETLAVRVVAPFPPFTYNEHGTDNTPIQAPLLLSDGTVIATREFGGAAGAGLIVRLDPVAGIRVLREAPDIPLAAVPRFSNAAGSMLNGQIAEGRDGMIYGTAQYGGAYGTGGIWRAPRDLSWWQLLWSWPDAAYPYGGLIAVSDGTFVGVTFGTSQIYRFVPPAGMCQ
jgi:hypothetical protein